MVRGYAGYGGDNLIDILIPVLDRPHRVLPLVENIKEATVGPNRIWFVVSLSDKKERKAIEDARKLHEGVHPIEAHWEPGPGDYAKKINYAARWTSELPIPGLWFFTGADDLNFHPGWDTAANRVMNNFPLGEFPFVIGTNDLGNGLVMRGEHATHMLIWRAYYERYGCSWDGPGVVFHEGYDHQYCDTELVAAAKQRWEWGFAKDSIVEHMHPFWGKGEQDATYAKGLAQGREDGKLFQERRRVHG